MSTTVMPVIERTVQYNIDRLHTTTSRWQEEYEAGRAWMTQARADAMREALEQIIEAMRDH